MLQISCQQSRLNGRILSSVSTEQEHPITMSTPNQRLQLLVTTFYLTCIAGYDLRVGNSLPPDAVDLSSNDPVLELT